MACVVMTKVVWLQVTHAAPLHALRRIHEAFPAAAATPDARTGALPLHLAVGSGLPVLPTTTPLPRLPARIRVKVSCVGAGDVPADGG